jgi:hypothetical protein
METLRLKEVALALVISATGGASAAHASSVAKRDWVQALPNGDQFATAFLSTKFERTSGSFAAIPASSSDLRVSLSGSFIVGQTKTVLKMPKLTAGKILADEIITIDILECKEGFYGTARTIKKLRGTTVREYKVPESEFNLFQASGPSLWKELCELNAAQEQEAHGKR